MFWDLVIGLALIGSWAYLAYLSKELREQRKDIDDLMVFNRISRYHALNDHMNDSSDYHSDGGNHEGKA